jgi:protein-L-isoaspartate(D-aspartate) O-methyltransferase
MVESQIRARGVEDSLVLAAMRSVPRHLFVPPDLVGVAYTDGPLPIGLGQTISQPYIVALMTELAELEGGETVLEVGTGSGYQAAVLAEIADTVYTIEIVEPLAVTAAARLDSLGYENVVVRAGDGYQGWAEHAPFDAVIVTAAPDHVPGPLVEQLRVGGRLVIPVGDAYQELLQITKTETGVVERRVIAVRFVPMTGEAERRGGGDR